jgi:hypothetical protein
MPVRGIIAYGGTEKWKGIYNHHDSSPGALGPVLWDRLKSGELTEMSLYQHPGGYLSYPDKCFCHGAQAETHGSCLECSPYYVKELPNMIFSHAQASPLLIRWVYVIDGDWLYVLAGHDTGRLTIKRSARGCKTIKVFAFRLVTTVYVPGPAPNWLSIEKMQSEFMEKVR